MRTDLSVVIIAKNAALRIGECIGAARRVAEEIIVIDSGSEDETLIIAADLGATIYHRAWHGFSATKNEGNSLASNDWILSLDADEVLSDALIDTILSMDFLHNHVYTLDRHNYYQNQFIKFCHWRPDYVYRIFNRRQSRWEGDFVHEKLVTSGAPKVIALKGPLIHYSYETYSQRKEKVIRYGQLSAQQRFVKGKRTNIVWAYIQPMFKFFITYFIHLGFLDGKAGLEIAFTDALGAWHRNKVMLELQKGNTPTCCQ